MAVMIQYHHRVCINVMLPRHRHRQCRRYFHEPFRHLHEGSSCAAPFYASALMSRFYSNKQHHLHINVELAPKIAAKPRTLRGFIAVSLHSEYYRADSGAYTAAIGTMSTQT